jgi:hypothetical protein
MANVLTVVWFVIGYVLAQTSIMVWVALMFPAPVGRARQRIERKPVASFFLGVLFWVVTIALAAALLQNSNPGPLKLLGWMFAAPMLVGSVVGGAAFAQLVAARLRGHMTNESPILALVGGALSTTLAGLLPIIGWFVFYPVAGFISVGAGVLGILSKREIASLVHPQQEQPESPAPSPAMPASTGMTAAAYMDYQT